MKQEIFDKALEIAKQVAGEKLLGIKLPHGRSIRHEVKIRVSKQLGGVDAQTRQDAANLAEVLARNCKI